MLEGAEEYGGIIVRLFFSKSFGPLKRPGDTSIGSGKISVMRRFIF